MKRLLLIILILGWVESAGAATYTVCSSGCNYTTIQGALNAVATGNTISVQDGTYPEIPITKAANVIIIAATGHTPHVRGFSIDHDNITLDGLYFDTVGETSQNQYRIKVSAGKTDWIIQNIHTGIACVGGVTTCSWGDLLLYGTGQLLNNHFDNPTYVSVKMYGSETLVQGNHWTNAHADIFYLFGTNHHIIGNEIENSIGDSSLHGDFIQTFGGDQNGSYGAAGQSYGHIIERNYVHGSPNNLQTCNLTQTGNPDTRDFTFRNNIFQDVAYSGNVMIPGVKFYNNTFINTTQNTGGVISAYPLQIIIGTDNKRYVNIKYTLISDAVKPITGANWATYFVEETDHPDITPTAWASLNYLFPGPSNADGLEIINNIFIGCGSLSGGNSENAGWYTVPVGLLNSIRSNNYVSKRADYATPYAAKSGWNTNSGNVNGGDPKFVSYATDNFALLAGGSVADKGATLAGFANDYLGNPRTGTWDIGAYEYGGAPTAPNCGVTLSGGGLR